jgi:hypothetical protein
VKKALDAFKISLMWELRLEKLKKFVLEDHWPLFLFIALNLVGIYFHECWRDEMQALLIAKAPGGIKEFFTDILHHEAHPFLWFFLLKLVSPFDVNPLAMQVTNSLLMIGTVSLFWFKFPLPRPLKSVLIFNYFFVFEYGLVARAYSLGIFLLFFYMNFFDSQKTWLRRSAFVALLLSMQVTIYTTLIAGCLFLTRFFSNFRTRKKQSILEALAVLACFATVVFQIIPAADYAGNTEVFSTFVWDRLVLVAALAGEMFLYMPAVQFYPRMWPVSFLFSPTVIILRGLLAAMIIGYLSYLFYKRNKHTWWPFALACSGLLLFSYMRFLGNVRHMAHLLLIVALFYWYSQKETPWQLSKRASGILFFLATWSAIAASIFYVADLDNPFSEGKNASKVISPSDKLIVTYPDFSATTLSGYLNGREIYSIISKRMQTYVRWDKTRVLETLDLKTELLAAMDKFKVDELTFVTSDPPLMTEFQQKLYTAITFQSKSCVVMDECFMVLKINRSYFTMKEQNFDEIPVSKDAVRDKAKKFKLELQPEEQ